MGEPVVLGLVVAWSWPGLALGVAALLAFTARTPLKVVLVDRRRGRWYPRTALAARFAVVETVALVALGAAGLLGAHDHRAWVPLLVGVPLAGVQLWFDAFSRSRNLLPEVTGAVGVCAGAAAVVLAGGGDTRAALGAWVIMVARVLAALPYARAQVLRAQGRPGPTWHSDLPQVLTVAVAAGGWLVGVVPAAPAVVLGLIGAAGLVMVRRPVRPAVVVGVEQATIGVILVVVSALTLRG